MCDVLSRAVFDFFVTLESNFIKKAQARSEFASLRGLCNLHTWQFQNVAAPQDISVGYVPFVKMVTDVQKQLIICCRNMNIIPRAKR